MSTKSTIIFATNNPNKVLEIRSLMDGKKDVISLREAGINIDIPEPHQTLEENAREKSITIFRLTGKDCFSEDTGLEVDALDGKPGVKSARYAGDECDDKKNIAKLLTDLKDTNKRTARFRTVISLILDGKEYQFEGVCEGSIASVPKGDNGFGYDPIFIPDGGTVCFAEMELSEKNKFSHRKKATAKLIAFLNNQHGKNQD